MNKKEFLKKLDIKLSALDYEVKKDILYDYEEHFRIALYEGKTEEEICADLGDPHEIAETYLIENYNVSPEQISLQALPAQNAGNNRHETELPQKGSAGYVHDKIFRVSVRDISYNKLVVQETEKESVYVQFLGDNDSLFYSEQKGDVLHILKNCNEDDNSVVINIYVPNNKMLQSLVILDCTGDILLKNTQINRCEISAAESNIVIDKITANDASISSSDGNVKISNSHLNNLKFDSSDGNFEMNSSNANSITVDTSDGGIRLTGVTVTKLSVDSSDGNIAVNSCSIHDITLDSSDGDCDVNSCTITALNVDTSDGNVSISNTNLNKLDIDTSDGNINLSKINAPQIKIDSSDGNVSLTDIIGNYIEINTSDGDIQISNCTASKCKMDSSGGNISAASCNYIELVIDASDGDINLNIDEISSLKCENSDGNIKVNIMKSYNSVEIENSDGNIVLNIPWEISFSGHIDVNDGDFNTKLPLIYNKGDIKYTSQRQKNSRILINNNDGNIHLGYSNKENGKESGFDFLGREIEKGVEEITKQFNNINAEEFFNAKILNKIVEPFKNFKFSMPDIPPIPDININIPSFYNNQNDNQKNYTVLNYSAKQWTKNPETPGSPVSITKVTSPDGVGIQHAYRLSGDSQNLAEIIYETSELEKNKHYAFTFWIKEDELQAHSGNKILQAEVIFDKDYENSDIFELSLITPLKTKNNWKLYELPFETFENETVQFKITAAGNIVFFTN